MCIAAILKSGTAYVTEVGSYVVMFVTNIYIDCTHKYSLYLLPLV